MSVTCEFTENTYESYQNKFYRCLVQNQTIKDDAKIEFTGNHLAGKANNDVTYIHFHNCVMSKLPKNLSKVFSNLHVISIHTTKLKSISKNDLSGLEKLQIFCMNDSEVEMIPGDLFGDYKCLEWIRFFNNPKLRIIEPNLLDKYENLKYVDLRQNIGFNVQYIDWTVPKTRHEEVRNYLAEQFFALDHQIIRDFLQKQDDPLEEIKKYTHRVKAIEKKVKMLEIRADVFEDTMNKGLIGDLKRFIQNENIKDFKINIGTKEFLVHKLLLATRCPTLAQEFSKNPDAVTLNITDISEEMFGQILKFLYTDKFPCEPGTNFIQLFGAAGRLKIVELKDLAVRKIKENVNIIDAVELLRLANKYNHDDLIETAFKQIKEEHPSIPFKDHWSHKPDKIKMVIDTFSN